MRGAHTVAAMLIAVIALIATSASAGFFTLSFEDLADHEFVPPYYELHTWSGDGVAGGSGDWFVRDLDNLNDEYGANLPQVHGRMVVSNAFGDDGTDVQLFVPYRDFLLQSYYVTRWPNLGSFGAATVTLSGYLNGELQYSISTNTVDGEWTFVDNFDNRLTINEIRVTNHTGGAGGEWWLMDGLELWIPAPGALALFGIAALGIVRRRRDQ